MSENINNQNKQPNLPPSEFIETGDSPAWDTDEEELSFNQSSSHLYPTDHSALVSFEEAAGHPTGWHTSHRSSTDHNILESGDHLSVGPGITTVSEQNTQDEVFTQGKFTLVTSMPGQPPNVDDLVKIFNRTIRNWTQNYARLKNSGSLQQGDIEDMRLKRSDAENQANDIFDIVEEESDTYNQVLERVNRVRSEMSNLYEINEKARQGFTATNLPPADISTAQPIIENADLSIDKEVMKLMSVMRHYHDELDQIIIKLPSVSDSGPNKENIELFKELLEAAKSCSKSAENAYLKIIAEVAVYNSKDKQTTQRSNSEQLWRNIQSRLEKIKKAANEHLHSFPRSDIRDTSKSSIPLERLPLPKFSGKKTEYSRFKLDFERHVKYDTEEECLLALKQKCLTKQTDKDRVANETNLKKCWERLDNEYGNLETTICDIFTSWRNLKPPINDKQFIDFMNQIENGVACLEALDSMHELSASAVINIEEKLDHRMQKEISKLITVNTDPTQKRKDIVLKYLKEEKRATQLRISNYSKGKQQQDETHSNFTSSRGRGRGRGRGGSNRGRDNSNKQYKNNPRASAKSSSCLLCGESHYLPKCPKWMDLSTDKRFLLGFCKTNWICTYCLNSGHSWKNCTSQDSATCPCSSTYNMMVCCETEDCRLRKNWDSTLNNTVSSQPSVHVEIRNFTWIRQKILR